MSGNLRERGCGAAPIVRHGKLLAALYAVVLVATVALATFAHSHRTLPGDDLLIGLIQGIELPAFAWLMVLVSASGNPVPALVLPLVVALGLLLARRMLAALFVALTPSGHLISEAAKALVDRPRPPAYSPITTPFPLLGDASFPSGHVLFATVFYGSLAFLWYGFHRGRRRWLGIPAAVLIALLMGAARIYLGAHWPTDVLGAYLIGGLYLSMLIAGYCVLARRPS